MIFFKFIIIFAQSQRLLYYGSVTLLEGGILLFTILFDVISHPKVLYIYYINIDIISLGDCNY